MTIRRSIAGILALGALATFVAASAACTASPRPNAVHGADQLPSDWMSLPESDWRLGALPAPTRAYLDSVRATMATERSGAYHRFYGRYTDATLKQIAEANNIANTAFLTAPKTINGNLTPELYNTAETGDEANWHFAVNANNDLRGLKNDWSRFWLTDSPSKLSPYPILPMGGQP